jgi:(p)ppGpp synthase/HD superfamily hydrolase
MRVIVDSMKDCYAAGVHPRALAAGAGGSKDYIAMPKFNLHQRLARR